MIAVLRSILADSRSTPVPTRRRLFVVLMRLLVALFLVLIPVLGGIQSWLTYRDKLKEQEQTLAAVVAAVQRPLAGAVWNEDRSGIDAQLKSIVRFPGVVYVRLRADLGDGADNSVHAVGVQPTDGLTLTVKLFAPESAGPHEPIGEMEVTADGDGLHQALRRELLGIFAMAAVQVLAVGLLLMWAVRKLVALPIESLAGHVKRLGQDLSTPPLPPAGRQAASEVAVLTDGINGMQELLCSHFDELTRLKDKLARQTDTLEASVQSRTDELNKAKLAAEAANRIKGQFLANVSHELRTPMNGLLISLDLLRRETVEAEERRRLASISCRSAEGLLELLDDIIDFSKLESGQVGINVKPCSPVVVVNTVINTLISRAREKGLALTARMLPSMPDMVITDPAGLRHILFNLIGNAVKFTTAGHVAVRGRRGMDLDDERFLLEFEVEDTGVGIASDVVPALFKRFTQADGSITRRFGGTGLGLAICMELCRLLDGEIAVDSAPGRGSVFRFTIACRACDGGQDVPLPDDDEQPVPALPPLRILAVDDNDINREAARALLEQSGHTVVTATGGEEAVRLTAETRFDVVLMDIQMPEMDGLAATRAIHALSPPNGLVPVIGWTAHVSETSRFDCLDAGMVGFVAKPLRRAVLFAEISAVLAVAPVVGSGEAARDEEPEVSAQGDDGDVLLDDELVAMLVDAMGIEEWPSFVQSFEHSARIQIAALKEGMETGADYGKAAHTLKGMSWSVGGRRLGNVALDIEQGGEDKRSFSSLALDDILAATVTALHSASST